MAMDCSYSIRCLAIKNMTSEKIHCASLLLVDLIFERPKISFDQKLHNLRAELLALDCRICLQSMSGILCDAYGARTYLVKSYFCVGSEQCLGRRAIDKLHELLLRLTTSESITHRLS